MSDDAKKAVSSPEPPAPAEVAPGAAASGSSAPPRFAWASLAVAAAAPVLMFFFLPPLSRNGLWDPYELNVADLSRRVAYNLYGAANLALDGADNSLPHLNDLGRPQLPFSSIGMGFKIFGLHEWAGRLPLAIWGLLGVLATYAFVSRLFDRRTGVYASVALSTMPLYFVQARTMLGDVCTMAGLAAAFGGLAVACFDRNEEGPTALGKRAPWLAMAAGGLFVGFESRGGLLGLGVPFLGIGLAWAAARVSVSLRSRSADRVGDVVGAVSLAAGTAVAAMAVRAVAAEGKDLDLWAGTVFHLQSKYPTYDFYVGAIGHALAPWSAFLPFAFGRVLFSPPPPQNGGAHLEERESLGRLAVIVCAAVAFVAHAYLAARTDLVAFSGPALCAVACAIALRDFERGAPASIAVGLGTLVIAAVLHHDFHELPDKAYQAFGVTGAVFPEGFKATALNLWWVALGGFALCSLLTWLERDGDRAPFDPASYSKVLRTLRESYDGVLVFVYFALIAGLSLAALIVLVGTRMHAQWLPQMSSTVRDVVQSAWWIVAFVPLGAVFGFLFACDVWLWSFGQSRPITKASLTRGFEPFEELFARIVPPEGQAKVSAEERWVSLLVVAPLMLLAVPAVVGVALYAGGVKVIVAAPLAVPSGVAFFLVMGAIGDALRHRASGLALGGAVVGFVLCFFYYPALANQLSPKEVFESYRHVCPGANLGLLGVGGRTSAYYAGGQPQTLTDPMSAYQWLTGGGGQRRCLALKAEELPKLNQLWREHAAEPKTNLPIVDARSSQILLAASSLGDDDKNENPLSSMVLASPPRFWRKIDANMDDKLEVLGIDLVDDRGHLVDVVSPGKPYHLKTYYRVLAPVGTEWEAFIHIDGYHRRHNGDHKPMNGKYPMSLWLTGDLVMDDHEFKLEPNFSPGNYTIFFGLFAGDTRLKVKSGPNDGDNRINGGALRVQ
jgi:4-amino-4-deoxy-L-arabinose transferase-like glycosyltransferase